MEFIELILSSSLQTSDLLCLIAYCSPSVHHEPKREATSFKIPTMIFSCLYVFFLFSALPVLVLPVSVILLRFSAYKKRLPPFFFIYILAELLWRQLFFLNIDFNKIVLRPDWEQTPVTRPDDSYFSFFLRFSCKPLVPAPDLQP